MQIYLFKIIVKEKTLMTKKKKEKKKNTRNKKRIQIKSQPQIPTAFSYISPS
jgi:hypothetical protein